MITPLNILEHKNMTASGRGFPQPENNGDA